MTKLGHLLEEMDRLDWSQVEEYSPPKGYLDRRSATWLDHLDKSDTSLHGSVLDVACGPVSLAILHSDVVGFDGDPKFILALREQSVRAIHGDLQKLPFDDNSFDICVCFNPPNAPYDISPSSLRLSMNRLDVDNSKLVRNVTSELIRVARKLVLISGKKYSSGFPPAEYRKFVDFESDIMVRYNLSNSH